VSEKVQEKNPLPLGNKEFDKIFDGGLYPGRKYLIFGANRTGKTQLCHQLCIQAAEILSSNLHAINKKVVYLDTENTFRPERIKEMCQTRKINYESVLQKILISRVMSNDGLLMALENIKKKIRKNDIKLLIIDSINNHYRVEQGEKEKNFVKIKSTFLECLNILHKITENYNLISVITSQITPNFSEKPIIKQIPVGNIYLTHFFSEYLYLHHKKQKKFIAQLVNSNYLPENQITYEITSTGI
jgi:RecA/RadA recombinase